jgi:hypothetical protein
MQTKRSTGRGGVGNIKRAAASGSVPTSLLTLDRASAIGGREAPTASISASKVGTVGESAVDAQGRHGYPKQVLSTGRGGSGNSAKAREKRDRVRPELPSRTAAIVAQYQTREDGYERDLITVSAEARRRNVVGFLFGRHI